MLFSPAVITPYFRESQQELERCHQSVVQQDVPCAHFLVADGFAKEVLSEWNVQHLILPSSHRDYGNTPRAIGAISAINHGHNPILFLDADNWFAPQHVSSIIDTKKLKPNADIVVSMRQLTLPDGTSVEPDIEDYKRTHVDTSCMAFFESAFFLLPLWGTMTKPLSVIGDRIMYRAMKMASASIAWTGKRTLFYTTNYAHHWRRAGKQPPLNTYKLDHSALKDFSSEQLYAWSRLRLNLRNQ